ncbi:MAG: hypothetical protein F4Y27_09655 [Acidimicrobiaceae bacterium]|nr:hypothetical protein [Acidimicrobiaceae bacterium]MXW61998.1 hypothetical protein [Acidimicrobiaceae bacterium]MXW75278.1 hypothetical protein [Acidimicrobiaceae bacterium]MYA74931.1 hypothetical protein [Acidimicrobiaceae bacterium]MYC43411.1 hypothetical protein [Acidimicrobiaceae bacterium]
MSDSDVVRLIPDARRALYRPDSAEGKRKWQSSAHVGDLAALRARSRLSEAEALCDPSGMGSFRILEWQV